MRPRRDVCTSRDRDVKTETTSLVIIIKVITVITVTWVLYENHTEVITATRTWCPNHCTTTPHYLYNKRRYVCLFVCLYLCSVWPAKRLGRSRPNWTHALMSTQGVFLSRSMSRSFMYARRSDRITKHPERCANAYETPSGRRVITASFWYYTAVLINGWNKISNPALTSRMTYKNEK